MIFRKAARLASPSNRIERVGHFGGLYHLRNCQPEYGDDIGMADLANQPRTETRQHLAKSLAIAQRRHFGRNLEPFGPLPSSFIVLCCAERS
jgi:hypothetical protein